MTRTAALLAILALSILLAGCAHTGDTVADSAGYGAPYGGLSDCAGYVYGYDPYNPAILYPAQDYGFDGPCSYPTRYYNYPYTYNSAPSIQERQRVAAIHRSGSPRVVGPRPEPSMPSWPYPTSSASSMDATASRAPVTTSTSTSSHPAPQVVSPR